MINKNLDKPWFIITAIGLLLVLVIDAGSGLGSPGLWLVVAGAILGIIWEYMRGRIKGASVLLVLWGITFTLTLLLNSSRDLNYFYPAILSSLLSLTVMGVITVRSRKVN